MPLLTIHHKTVYRYARPVAFGEHRNMLRPRDGHDLRVLDSALAIDPQPMSLRWIHDVFGKSVMAERLDVSLEGIELIRPREHPKRKTYVEELYRLRQRKGLSLSDADFLMRNYNYFGTMMVHMGDAEGLVSGVNQHYPDVIRPALLIIGPRPGLTRVCGVYCIIARKKCYFFADTTVNIQPTSEELAEIAILASGVAREFGFEPRVAMLSLSSFGSVKHPLAEVVRDAVVSERPAP